MLTLVMVIFVVTWTLDIETTIINVVCFVISNYCNILLFAQYALSWITGSGKFKLSYWLAWAVII